MSMAKTVSCKEKQRSAGVYSPLFISDSARSYKKKSTVKYFILGEPLIADKFINLHVVGMILILQVTQN